LDLADGCDAIDRVVRPVRKNIGAYAERAG
jgi:hypothetical protein